MYMMTDSMLMLSPLIPIAFGGIGGSTTRMAVAGDSAGGGVLHGITIVGMVPVTGAAAIGVVIGDITIIITTIPAMDGVVVTGEVVMDGMVQANVIPEYTPEDIPTAIIHHVQAGITT